MSPGPKLRTDIVDVYVFEQQREDARAAVRFLQLHRAREPLKATWQPVMGHVQAGETALACALREVGEEAGLGLNNLLGLWALEQVHPFLLAERDEIVLSPRFVARAAWDWTPTLNDEHDAWRWVGESEIDQAFLWPGQVAACREALDRVIRRPLYTPLVTPRTRG